MKRFAMLAACLAVVISGAGCSVFYSYEENNTREIGLFGLPRKLADEVERANGPMGLIPLLRYDVER